VKKIILFGAGRRCKVFLDSKARNNFDIIAIADNNNEKWDTTLFGIPIISPIAISDYEYDYILITARCYYDIFGQLVKEYKIKRTKILLLKGNRIEGPIQIVARFIFIENIKTFIASFICRSLLEEAALFGEFDNISKIILWGEIRHYKVISKFIKKYGSRISVTMGSESECSVSGGKHLITSAEYLMKQKMLNEKGVEPENILVLPFFDVRNKT